MEHIQHPNDPISEVIKVPYLCKNDYDGLQFSDNASRFYEYPMRQGYNSEASVLELRKTDGFEGFVQNWLYFGLLTEFLGIKPSTKDFVRESVVSGRPVLNIYTGELSRLLGEWKFRILSFETKRREQYLVELYGYIFYATQWVERLDTQLNDNRDQTPLILFSIKVLIESLIMAILDYNSHFKPLESKRKITSKLKKYAYSFRRNISVSDFTILPDISSHFDPHLRDIEWIESQLPFPTASEYIRRQMISAGWCPHYLAHIGQTYSSSALYYLSTIRCKSTSGKCHSACREKDCAANNIDEATYESKHEEATCKCPLMRISEEELIDMIKNGDTPLVSFKKDPNNGEYSISLVAANPHSLKIIAPKRVPYYIAISHVWSSGRGNPKENSLHLCQLKAICAYIDKISYRASSNNGFLKDKSWVFWMDTLCIPVSKNEDAKAMKKKAIGHMDVVYANAEKVLVLDRELEETSHLDLNLQELFARIRISSWMTRCWTLQEAALAQHLSIQFSDGNLDMSHSLDEHSKSLKADNIDINWDTRRRLCPFDNKVIVNGPGLETVLYPTNSLANFARTWNALAYRSTSKHRDIYAILAVLNGFNAAALLALNSEESQFRAILKRQKRLPMSFLTDHFEARQSDNKNQWAPLRLDGTRVSTEDGWMEVGDEELVVNTAQGLQGFIIPKNVPKHQQFCLVDAASQKRWYIKLDSLSTISSPNEFPSCIFMIAPPTLHVENLLPEIHEFKTPQKGFQISIHKHDQHTIFGGFDCPVEIWLDVLETEAQNWPVVITEVKPTFAESKLILDCGKSLLLSTY